ncbi:MAG: hypothetical protein LBV45_07610, partial [Xanthomonadaceae bacterium]|nr:hypothetical protein [Xanthomonadaceae bacterium]
GQERVPAIRESIAKALYNKATALNQVYWYEEAIETYEALIARFGKENIPSVQALITPARIAAAYIRIPLAKRDWEQAIVANERLNAAIVDLRQVIGQCGDEESRISIAGRLGYALFLIGRNDEAIKMIRESLQLGGKAAFETQREDAHIWRLEVEDNKYDQLLADAWAELYPEEYY